MKKLFAILLCGLPICAFAILGNFNPATGVSGSLDVADADHADDVDNAIGTNVIFSGQFYGQIGDQYTPAIGYFGVLYADGPLYFDTNNAVTNYYGGTMIVLGGTPGATEGSSVSGGLNSSVVPNDSDFAFGTACQAVGGSSYAGGDGCVASGGFAWSFGFQNVSSGFISATFGEADNATMQNSMAFGANANATNLDTFVWSDGKVIGSGTNNSLTMYAANGYRLLGGVISGNGFGLTLPAQTNVTLNAISQGVATPINLGGATNFPASVITNNATGVTLSGTFSGSGAGLTFPAPAQISLPFYWQMTPTATENAAGVATLPSFFNTGNNILEGLIRGNGFNQPNLTIPAYVFQGGSNIVVGLTIGSTNAVTWTYTLEFDVLTNGPTPCGLFNENLEVFTTPAGTNIETYYFTNAVPIGMTNSTRAGSYFQLSGPTGPQIWLIGGTFQGRMKN